MAYPECAGCGKNLSATGGATITIRSLKPKYRKEFGDGVVSVLVCNDDYTSVYEECFNKAWRKYSTTQPPER